MIIKEWPGRFSSYFGSLFHPSKLLIWALLWLFIWLFFPVKPYLSYDNHAVAMQPVTLVNGEGFELSRFQESQFAWKAWEQSNHHVSFTYILIAKTAKAIGNYPIFSAVLMLPFYGLYSIFYPELWSITSFNALLWSANYVAAVSFTVLTAWVWAKLLRGYGLSWKLVMVVVLVGIFATPVITVSSRFVWQHTTALLFNSLALWAFRERKGWLFHLMTVVGVLCRPGTILLMWPIMVFYWGEWIWRCWQGYINGVRKRFEQHDCRVITKLAWRTFTTEPMWLAFLMIFLMMLSIAIQMWYSVNYLDEWFAFAPQYSMQRFDTSQWWEGLTAQLFSPGRGLFFFSPMWLLAIVGWPRLAKREYVFVAGALTYHLVCGAWDMWHGGWSLSYRLVMDAIPIYLIGFGLFLQAFAHIKWLAVVAGVLVSWAVLQHAVMGVFWEDCGYNSWPENIDLIEQSEFMQRIWSDTAFNRCVWAWQHKGFHPKFYWGR